MTCHSARRLPRPVPSAAVMPSRSASSLNRQTAPIPRALAQLNELADERVQCGQRPQSGS